jgi:hypothetical protein
MAEIISTVSVEVPEPFYRRLQHIAEITHRSVEDVLISSVNAVLPQAQDIPPSIANELAAMSMFNDEALWASAASSLAPSQSKRLQQLNAAAKRRSLTPAEDKELETLIEDYDRAVLRRARALALLAHRGYDITQQLA